jgi:hypothetical protein
LEVIVTKCGITLSAADKFPARGKFPEARDPGEGQNPQLKIVLDVDSVGEITQETALGANQAANAAAKGKETGANA